MKQTVGILLDHMVYKGLLNNRTGYEQISLYNKAANQLGIEPFYMTLRFVGKKTAIGFINDGKRYRRTKRTIPVVTLNRTIVLAKTWRNKLKKLANSSIVYNRMNRFSKFRIYQLLADNRYLARYLPYTMLYTRANLQKAMNNYSSIYIKPSSGSVGKGIIRITQTRTQSWKLYWKKGQPIIKKSKDLIRFIENYVGTKSYIIQEAIPLATYNGKPYDIRVSVQKGSSGKWQVTGMVGKVAAKGRHVTNVARGGKVKRCEPLFQSSGFDIDKMKRAVTDASLEIAKYLAEKLPHLADIGLDMGIDRAGNIKMIEMNGRDQRITFKKAKMTSTFYQTYATPLQYAAFLLKQHTNKDSMSHTSIWLNSNLSKKADPHK